MSPRHRYRAFIRTLNGDLVHQYTVCTTWCRFRSAANMVLASCLVCLGTLVWSHLRPTPAKGR